jgi:hypothetical protein
MTTATETSQVLKEMDNILRLLEARIPANPESLNTKLNGIKLDNSLCLMVKYYHEQGRYRPTNQRASPA